MNKLRVLKEILDYIKKEEINVPDIDISIYLKDDCILELTVIDRCYFAHVFSNEVIDSDMSSYELKNSCILSKERINIKKKEPTRKGKRR